MLAWVMNLGFAGSKAATVVITGQIKGLVVNQLGRMGRR